MSEKRFFTKINKNGRNVIIDKECHIELIDLTLACDVLNRLDLKLKTYNEQLGEQQATIKKLQDLNKKWKEMDEQLREINKEIGDELKLWQDVHKEYGIYSIKDFEESFELDAKINKEKGI